MSTADANDAPTVRVLATAADTQALGVALADLVRPGDLIVLSGPLGAGKTALAKGIGDGLGVGTPVASPTFVIARSHPDGRVPLVHVDAYRLQSLAEVDDLDLDRTAEDAVTVVEWGVGLVEGMADARLEIRLSLLGDGDRRRAELVGHGGDWATRLTTLGGEDPRLGP